MKQTLEVGKTYDIDGIYKGVFVQYDKDGDPFFKIEEKHPYGEDEDGLVGFADTMTGGDYYEEV